MFTTLDNAERPGDIKAFTYYSFRPDTEACPVIIYPAAMTALDILEYKQLIAHEIFHCFQAWNLPDQLLGPGNDSKWWAEGSAEYFSNLVYPEVNFEHRSAADFSRLSTFRPLTNMSYGNFAFFQFMGNRIHPEGVIAMLRTMPTIPGLDAQIAALAAVPDMEATFEEFVRSVLDNTLYDSDGETINIPINYTNEFLFTDIASIDFSGQPFVVARYRITFAGEREFTIFSVSVGAGRSGARVGGAAGGWALIPVNVGGCGELEYILYVITTTPGVERAETIATTSVTEAPCDECLIGRWEATNDSIISYMQAVVSAGGDNVPTVESVTGTMFMEFDANGFGFGGYENLTVHETGVGGNEGTEVFYTFDGFSGGAYRADGSVLTGMSETTDIVVTVQIFANGVSMGSSTVPFRQEDFPVGSAIPTGYTCDGDTLTVWPPVAGTIVEPITYIRG